MHLFTFHHCKQVLSVLIFHVESLEICFSRHICVSNILPVKSLEDDETKRTVQHHSEIEMWECFLGVGVGGCNHGVQSKHLLLTQLWIMGGWWDSLAPVLFPHTQSRGFPIAAGRACCYSTLTVSYVWLSGRSSAAACNSTDRSQLICSFGATGTHTHTRDTVLYI